MEWLRSRPRRGRAVLHHGRICQSACIQMLSISLLKPNACLSVLMKAQLSANTFQADVRTFSVLSSLCLFCLVHLRSRSALARPADRAEEQDQQNGECGRSGNDLCERIGNRIQHADEQSADYRCSENSFLHHIVSGSNVVLRLRLARSGRR